MTPLFVALDVDGAVEQACHLLGLLTVEEYDLRLRVMIGSRFHRGCLLADVALPEYGLPLGWVPRSEPDAVVQGKRAASSSGGKRPAKRAKRGDAARSPVEALRGVGVTSS